MVSHPSPFPGQSSCDEAGSPPHHKVKPKASPASPHLKHFLPSPWEAKPHTPVCTVCSPGRGNSNQLALPYLGSTPRSGERGQALKENIYTHTHKINPSLKAGLSPRVREILIPNVSQGSKL